MKDGYSRKREKKIDSNMWDEGHKDILRSTKIKGESMILGLV